MGQIAHYLRLRARKVIDLIDFKFLIGELCFVSNMSCCVLLLPYYVVIRQNMFSIALHTLIFPFFPDGP